MSLSFIVLALFYFSQGIYRKDRLCMQLQGTIQELERIKERSLEEREDLVLQINSRNDKDWMEMILKKKLGVVPEGQMKIYFRKDE